MRGDTHGRHAGQGRYFAAARDGATDMAPRVRRRYIRAMKTFLMIALFTDLAAVVVVMLIGAVGMANLSRDPRTSNRLMRWRVLLQGVGVGLVVLLMLTGR